MPIYPKQKGVFPKLVAKIPLRNYFSSGWTFLIPYLVAYLFFAWLDLPVNPNAGGDGLMKGISETGALASGHRSFVPSLLHVYWGLHTIHVVLASIVLWNRFQSSTGRPARIWQSYPSNSYRLDGCPLP